MLGNIKFIGELGKLDMLHEGILHRCIQQLLEKKKKKQTVQDMGEDYECLCQILRTIGKSLDHDKAKLWMDQYFDRIRTIMGNPELPNRIRYMLLDALELRRNQWMPRKTMMDTGPKTIQQVRDEAIRANHKTQQEYGGMMQQTHAALSNLSMNTDMFGRPLNGSMAPKSTMGDIFGPMSPPFMGSNTGIGTGPGVLDDFTPAFMSGKSGKQNSFNLKQAPFGNRGKQQEGRGGSSPRFEDRYRNRNNNTPPYQHPEKEADREDDNDDHYGSSRNRQQNRDNYSNRYTNIRDNRQQTGNQANYRNNQNQDYNQQFRSRDDQDGGGGGLLPKYTARQRSPYGRDEQEEKPKENRSQDDNWRRDRSKDTRDDRDQKQDSRDDRSGPYRYDRARDPPPARGQDDGERDRSRGQNWDRGRGDWQNDRSDSGDRKQRDRDRDNQPPRREEFNRDDRGRYQQQGNRPYKDQWDSFDNKKGDNYSRDRDLQRGGGRGFDDQRDNKDFHNGDVDSRNQGDRFDHGRDTDRRDFNSDFRSNNRDFRDNNRDFGGRDNRDFRDNRDNRDLKDNKGFRDFGEARGFDRDRGFQRGGGQQQQQRDGQQPAARELPPRFQKKQQQQQGTPPDPLFPTTEVPPTVPEDPIGIGNVPAPQGIPPGAPPQQRFRHPLHVAQHPPQPGLFPPRFPPPGGPPMRGPPPHGFPIAPSAPFGMPPHAPRFSMGGGSPRETGSHDSPRDNVQSLPGGPGMSPPQNLPKGPAKVDEISLRPARNFPTLLRPGAPSMLPRSAQNPHSVSTGQIQIPDLLGPAPGGPQVGIKTTNLTIKQVSSADKNKNKDSRKVPNKEELKQATDEMMKTFMELGNIADTVEAVRDMKPPRRFMPEMISMMIIQGLEKGDAERENISSLILQMKEQRILASDLYLDGLCNVLDRMSELEQEIALVKSNVAKFAAQAVGSDIITLSNLAELLDNGAHYPFFLLCLQQLHKVKDKDWLIKSFNESKIELLNMLPECDRTKERMVEILEDRNLSFMFPLLRVQSDLWRQIRVDPNPSNFYKWIKENVDTTLQNDHGFIKILITTVLRFITGESTIRSDQDPHNPDKNALDKEKDLLDKFKGVLQRLLFDRLELQMTAIYAIQVFGHNADFPKGLMLRLFMHMYDMEIIDEETFLKWKEEVNDGYPGKGKVLFQVHQWLTWLEQAEEESEDDEN